MEEFFRARRPIADSAADEGPEHLVLRTGGSDQRWDLAIHFLAQLPDWVSLEVPGDHIDRSLVQLMATAYGIEERVLFAAPQRVLADQGWFNFPPNQSFAEVLHMLVGHKEPLSTIRGKDSCLSGHRIALVTNVLAPYRVPLFSAVAARLRACGGELAVFLMSEQSSTRPWIADAGHVDFHHQSLRSIRLPIGERRSYVPISLSRSLRAFRPTILVSGGISPFVADRLARLATRHGAVLGIWSGEIGTTATARSRLRHLYRSRIVSRAHFAISYGWLAGEYLHALRPDLPCIYGRNTSIGGPRRAARDMSSPVALLAVADMASDRKGLDVLIDALRISPHLSCTLTVIGGGRLLSRFRARAAGDPRVRFLGAVPFDQVQHHYARADVFLFPTREDIFGLALVEAMASGLTVLTSHAPGALADLGVPHHNCIVVNSHDPNDWATAIGTVATDEALRTSLGAGAMMTILSRWTMEHSVDAMIAGLRLGALVSRQP